MIPISEVEGLTLGPVTEKLTRAASTEGWLDDEAENRQQGYGKGFEGREHARMGLLNLLERENLDSDFGLIGVYLSENPVGFVGIDLITEHKIADIYFYIAPKSRRKGLGSAVLNFILNKVFDGGMYRVQIDILRINKGGLQFLRGFGFTWESTKKSAYWMDKNVYDVAHLRLLRPDWTKLQEESE